MAAVTPVATAHLTAEGEPLAERALRQRGHPGGSSTTINGINDEGALVGFYTDAKGNTDGFLALP
jgi:hypothetical protein